MILATKTILTAQCAFNAHEEPVDKLGVPYIFHLMEVTEKTTEEETIVALLHDFLEDSHPEWDDYRIFNDPYFSSNMHRYRSVLNALFE